MEIKIVIPEYSIDTGLKIDWDYGFEIETNIQNNSINIIANKQGLISLAKILLSLSQESIPSGYHLHLDEYNSLEEGSYELIIQKS